ncbi:MULTISPECIES: hypothetical protein [Enterococcus]|uniref:hypothetical protein n=1 Tax=Enterococcus TaxID=1350 RepID=UPI00288F46C4|nr:hypothetical protein [Enterococcus avium]MDT2486300.1 hypothetical protein [Enterococcus avium]MDT2517449.1 hypothetical protein [Enterococcus avium]
MDQTLQEKKQELLDRQEALIRKRNKINQDLKDLKKKMENVEKDYLMEMLEESNVSVAEAIELLGIDYKEHKDDY